MSTQDDKIVRLASALQWLLDKETRGDRLTDGERESVRKTIEECCPEIFFHYVVPVEVICLGRDGNVAP